MAATLSAKDISRWIIKAVDEATTCRKWSRWCECFGIRAGIALLCASDLKIIFVVVQLVSLWFLGLTVYVAGEIEYDWALSVVSGQNLVADAQCHRRSQGGQL